MEKTDIMAHAGTIDMILKETGITNPKQLELVEKLCTLKGKDRIEDVLVFPDYGVLNIRLVLEEPFASRQEFSAYLSAHDLPNRTIDSDMASWGEYYLRTRGICAEFVHPDTHSRRRAESDAFAASIREQNQLAQERYRREHY